MPYRYRCRPGYNTDELLLEFFLEGQQEALTPALRLALQPAKTTIRFLQHASLHGVKLYELLVNGEPFRLTFDDTMDCASIKAENNQPGITYIDEALQASHQFTKEQVDFADYRTE